MKRKITFIVANQLENLSDQLAQAAKTDARIALAGIAKSASEGAELVKTHLPDILIMDMELENSDGIGLLESIQGIHPKPVVIVTSPMADRQLCNQFSDLGVDYLLIRPIDNDIILERFFSCVTVLSQNKN